MSEQTPLSANDYVRRKDNHKITGTIIEISDEGSARIRGPFRILHEDSSEWEKVPRRMQHEKMSKADSKWITEARENIINHEQNIGKALDHRDYTTVDMLRGYCETLHRGIKEIEKKYSPTETVALFC